jgi:hypothetical protein
MDKTGNWTAQICLNGHVVTPQLDNFPAMSQNFCSTCGVKTITTCQKCQDEIRGLSRYARPRDTMHGGNIAPTYVRPAYCPNCGEPYPWTDTALEAAADLASEIELSESDATALKATFADLVHDTPQTTVAASRFRRIIAKAGPMAAEGFKTILVNVVTEAAKKLMFPGH